MAETVLRKALFLAKEIFVGHFNHDAKTATFKIFFYDASAELKNNFKIAILASPRKCQSNQNPSMTRPEIISYCEFFILFIRVDRF